MQAILIKVFFRVVSLLPLWLVHLTGSLLGYINWLLRNRHFRVASRNIQQCFPELSAQQQAKLVKQSLLETSKTFSEMGVIWMAPLKRVFGLVNSVEGKALVDAALKQQHGVIFALPHLGSWELVNLYLAEHYPVTSLYKPAKLPALDDFIRQSRQRNGANLVPTNAAGVRALSSALKNQQALLILPDQQPSKGNGIFSPFFGHAAYTMTLLPRLANKYNSPIIYVFAERLKKGKGFHIHFSPASTATYDSDLSKSTDAINKDVEQIARQYPSQYQWTYKRFKYRPDDDNLPFY